MYGELAYPQTHSFESSCDGSGKNGTSRAKKTNSTGMLKFIIQNTLVNNRGMQI